MDSDLGRLKMLSRCVFVVMGLLTLAVIALSVLLIVGLWVEVNDPGSISEDIMDSDQMVAFIACVVVMLLLVAVVLLMLANVARAISREYSPFTRKNVKRLETISVAYLIMPFVIIALGYIIVDGTSPFEIVVLLLSGMIMAAVFYMLALIFDYGCWLQKESDETL